MKHRQSPGSGTRKVKARPGQREPARDSANAGGRKTGRSIDWDKRRQARETCANCEPGRCSGEDVIEVYARRLRLEPHTLLSHLKLAAAANIESWTVTEARRLLQRAMQLGLDPLAGEVYLQSRESPEQGGGADSVGLPPLLVVSLDGWCRVLNSHPMFDGVSFSQPEPGEDGLPAWLECTIHRKDRRVATSVREYMQESRQPYGAWLSHPARMLRHKALVQCARVCFALVGVLDPDEAERVAGTREKAPPRRPGNPAHARTGRPLGTVHLKAWLQGSQGP
jgi:hypothetical protein